MSSSSCSSPPCVASCAGFAAETVIAPPAPMTAYNLQQPSVGFYNRGPLQPPPPPPMGLAPRQPTALPDTANSHMAKSITKRLANATHYQQVCDRTHDDSNDIMTYIRTDQILYPPQTLILWWHRGKCASLRLTRDHRCQ